LLHIFYAILDRHFGSLPHPLAKPLNKNMISSWNEVGTALESIWAFQTAPSAKGLT
jgi:hypothetical protein